jgi:hypothetical protein
MCSVCTVVDAVGLLISAGQSLQAIKMCFQYLPRAYKHGAKGACQNTPASSLLCCAPCAPGPAAHLLYLLQPHVMTIFNLRIKACTASTAYYSCLSHVASMVLHILLPLLLLLLLLQIL